MDYELALKGLNDIEKYVEQIDRIVSEHVETELTQDEDGFVYTNRLFVAWLDYETMGLDVLQDEFGFEADVSFIFRLHRGRNQDERLGVIFRIILYFVSLGCSVMLTQESSEILRNTGNGYEIHPDYQGANDYPEEEMILRLLQQK